MEKRLRGYLEVRGLDAFLLTLVPLHTESERQGNSNSREVYPAEPGLTRALPIAADRRQGVFPVTVTPEATLSQPEAFRLTSAEKLLRHSVCCCR
jgi:hypothetical protein